MPNRSQEQNRSNSKKFSSWDDVISDIKGRINDLQFSLKIFQQRKAAGEPWPLQQKAGTEAESIPA